MGRNVFAGLATGTEYTMARGESPASRTDTQEVAAGRTAGTPVAVIGTVVGVIAVLVLVVAALVVLGYALA